MPIRDFASKKNKNNTKNAKIFSKNTSKQHFGSKYRTKKRHIIISPMLFLVALMTMLFVGSILYIEYIRSVADTQIVKDLTSPPVQKTKQITQVSKINDKIVNTVKDVIKRESKKDTEGFNRELEEKQPAVKFEFYHTLPNMEVAIAKEVQEATRAIVKNQTEFTSTSYKNSEKTAKSVRTEKVEKKEISDYTNKNYIIQIASFRDLKDAQDLRAKLLLEGYEIIIQTVDLPSSGTWHRVKTHKIDNLQLAQNMQQNLKSKKIGSIILTDRG